MESFTLMNWSPSNAGGVQQLQYARLELLSALKSKVKFSVLRKDIREISDGCCILELGHERALAVRVLDAILWTPRALPPALNRTRAF